LQDDLEYIKYYHLAKAMHERNDDYETITKKLMDHGLDQSMVDGIVKQVKEEYNKKKHQRGLVVLLVGLVVLLVSFVLTCINFHSNESITYVMFGISSVGLIIMFFGLYDLFG
jgi:uncharacterized integral membrane protein